MFDKINGLPGHVLLVHAVIVLVPIACLMLVAGAVWPAAQRRLGIGTPIVAFVALVLVPITTSAGEWLRDHLGYSSAAIRKHTELGDSLLPWAGGVFLLSVAVWFAARRYDLAWKPAGARADGPGAQTTVRKQALPTWAVAVLAVVCVAVAVGTMIQLYRIGDSGAHAVWDGRTN